MSYYQNKGPIAESEDQEGEIRSSENSSSSDNQQGQLNQRVEDHRIGDQIYDSVSSEEDNDRLEEQKKKRQDFWKTINQPKKDAVKDEINWYENAMQSAAKTNKKMLILRKKNIKRVQLLQSIRMSQQPYLGSVNTHYRSSINEYPLMTISQTGKKHVHPNISLRAYECRLDQFIQKNISEEGTSNYLNEVVKFENFAYQHRKKRKQQNQ